MVSVRGIGLALGLAGLLLGGGFSIPYHPRFLPVPRAATQGTHVVLYLPCVWCVWWRVVCCWCAGKTAKKKSGPASASHKNRNVAAPPPTHTISLPICLLQGPMHAL